MATRKRTTRTRTELGRVLFAGGLPTVILPNPNGTYQIAGRIPADLTVPVTTPHTPQIPPLRRSIRWATEQEAIDALLALGITHFQRADCSWYDAPKEA